MSHIAKIELDIYDLDALEKACKRLNCKLIKNQKNYKWYGTFIGDYPLPDGVKEEDLGKCDHIISVPGSEYEIGVVKQGNKYNLIYDFWGGQKIEEVCGGRKLGKIKQGYTIETLKGKLAKKKAKIKEKMEGNKLVLTIEVG
jgi:hypothetical protein